MKKSIKEETVSNSSGKFQIGIINYVEDYIDGDDFNDIFSDVDVEILFDKFNNNIIAYLIHKCKIESEKEFILKKLESLYDLEFANTFNDVLNLLSYNISSSGNQTYQLNLSDLEISNSVDSIYPKEMRPVLYIEDETSLWIITKITDSKEIEKMTLYNNLLSEKLALIGEILESDIVSLDEYNSLKNEILNDKVEEDQEPIEEEEKYERYTPDYVIEDDTDNLDYYYSIR